MSKPTKKKAYGLLAEYETAAAVFHACEQVRDAGYSAWDSHTPFAVHNLDKAMGLKPSVLPWIVFAMGMTGASCALHAAVVDRDGRLPDHHRRQALLQLPGVRPGDLRARRAALRVRRGVRHARAQPLPMWYHSLFNSERFHRFSDDKFFIAIEARDPKYDPERTRKLLEGSGALHVEEVED
jgi:hypothetical protein